MAQRVPKLSPWSQAVGTPYGSRAEFTHCACTTHNIVPMSPTLFQGHTTRPTSTPTPIFPPVPQIFLPSAPPPTPVSTGSMGQTMFCVRHEMIATLI